MKVYRRQAFGSSSQGCTNPEAPSGWLEGGPHQEATRGSQDGGADARDEQESIAESGCKCAQPRSSVKVVTAIHWDTSRRAANTRSSELSLERRA
jgi:hypothetical protein